MLDKAFIIEGMVLTATIFNFIFVLKHEREIYQLHRGYTKLTKVNKKLYRTMFDFVVHCFKHIGVEIAECPGCEECKGEKDK